MKDLCLGQKNSLIKQKFINNAVVSTKASTEGAEIKNISEKLSINPLANTIAPVTGKQKYVNPAINTKNK